MNLKCNKVKSVKGKLIVSFVLMYFMSLSVNAQKATDDFKKIGNALRDAHISFETRYTLYANYTSELPIQTKQGVYYLWDKMLHYKIEEIEVISNDRFNLSIDNSNKKMVLNKTNTGFEEKYLKQALKINLDSLLARNSEVVLLSKSDSSRTWRITYRHLVKGIKFIDLKFDLSGYHLSKIVLYYDKSFNDIYGTSPQKVSKTEKPRLEISYSNYNELNEGDKEKYFSAKEILSLDKSGNAVIADSHKKYFLANYYQLLKK